METHCVGLKHCLKKSCIEQERCEISLYWEAFWREKAKSGVEVPVKYQPKKVIKKILHAGYHRGQRKKVLYPDCGQHLCNKHKVCEILGQCVLQHADIKGKKHHENYLRKQLSFKDVVRYLENLKPALKRIGPRKYYRPEKQL